MFFSFPHWRLIKVLQTKRKAKTLPSTTFTFNGDIWFRNNLNIAVSGRKWITLPLKWIFTFPKEKQLWDNHTRVDHLVPHCDRMIG